MAVLKPHPRGELLYPKETPLIAGRNYGVDSPDTLTPPAPQVGGHFSVTNLGVGDLVVVTGLNPVKPFHKTQWVANTAGTEWIEINRMSNYIVETYILDAGATGAATANIPQYTVLDNSGSPVTTPSVLGATGKTLQISAGYRGLLIFFKSDTAGGSYMTVDGVRYNADYGGSRADPVITRGLGEDYSEYVDEPAIEAFDGAIVEVQVQRSV